MGLEQTERYLAPLWALVPSLLQVSWSTTPPLEGETTLALHAAGVDVEAVEVAAAAVDVEGAEVAEAAEGVVARLNSPLGSCLMPWPGMQRPQL